MVYLTAGSRDEAVRIAWALVDERLAACANILGDIDSVYRWQGEVRSEPEVAFIVKTRVDRTPALTERVTELHSYDCPCVAVLPIRPGNPAFFDWLAESTFPP